MTETTSQAQQNWFGSIVHTELATTDTAATTDFLSKVFGMTFEAMDGPMEYHTSYVEGRPSCGVRPVLPEEPGPGQTPFIEVSDLDAAVEKATANGGTVLVPRTPVPGMGWFSWFQAPGGPVVAAWQNDQTAA